MSEKRTIRVSGSSVQRVAPDTIEVTFSVDAHELHYDKMLHESDKQLRYLQKLLVAAGFGAEELRTKHYRITTVEKTIRKELPDGEHEYYSVFDGYRCDQTFLIKFPMDIPKLHKLLQTMDQNDVHPSFTIDFTLRDAKQAEEEALRQATLNARREADIITAAAGVKLGHLLSVNRSCGGYYGGGASICSAELNERSVGSMQPDNISVEASIDFEWEIE
ncbi:MAG: SIMPL domain-containing protein [Oscillospiraceae bacterium]|nr:SIMPL domain-containing protein [Oscillospiraceae bacterium]